MLRQGRNCLLSFTADPVHTYLKLHCSLKVYILIIQPLKNEKKKSLEVQYLLLPDRGFKMPFVLKTLASNHMSIVQSCFLNHILGERNASKCGRKAKTKWKRCPSVKTKENIKLSRLTKCSYLPQHFQVQL